MAPGTIADRIPLPAHRPRGHRAPPPPGCRRVRDGVRAADLARPVDGRALLAGERRRLQGGADRRRPRAQALPDADDGGRHDRARARPDHGRRRRGPAGDRDRPAARRRRLRVRRAPGGEGAGRVARRQVPRARRAGRGDRGRLREGAHARAAGSPAGGARGAAARLRRRDHDGADPRPPRSQADPRLRRREHAPRQLHRRPRRRGRRQLRAHAARHRDRARGRHDRRLHEPALDDVVPREPALLPQRPLAAAAPRTRRRAGARLRATRSPPAPALPASPRLPPRPSRSPEPAPDAPEEESA